MPPKKKATVAKKRPSHGGKGKKVSKTNKTKTKATKRKTQMKKRRDKRAQKQRKERKKTEKAKRAAKKKKTKRSKKKKDKKKKKAPKKVAPKETVQKEKPPSDRDDDDGSEEEAIGMKLAGMTINQMQNLRKTVAELTKDEFLEQMKNHREHRNEQMTFQAAYMTSAENRAKLFYDLERPTDYSAGPFQTNRFGAVFLIPGHQ